MLAKQQIYLELLDSYHIEVSQKLRGEKKEKLAREIADNLHALVS